MPGASPPENPTTTRSMKPTQTETAPSCFAFSGRSSISSIVHGRQRTPFLRPKLDLTVFRCFPSACSLGWVCNDRLRLIMYLTVPIGFDTAASIALIAVSAIAHKGTNGVSIPSSNVIILPVKTILYSSPWLLELLLLLLQLLFTAGMTLVDSADSVLVLYSYAGLPSTPSWSLVTRTKPEENVGIHADRKDDVSPTQTIPHDQVKMNAMSTLSITLTFMSILVAFSISLITIMGLIGERCSQCAAAANAEDGGGLAGSWWRAWARVCICICFCFCWRHGSVIIIQANDNSGYIGVAIIGMFLVLGIGWLLRAWWLRRRSRRGQALSSE